MTTTSPIPFNDPLTPTAGTSSDSSSNSNAHNRRVSLTLSRTPTASHPASSASSPDRLPLPFYVQQEGRDHAEGGETEGEEESHEEEGSLGEEEEEEGELTPRIGYKAPLLQQFNDHEEDDEDEIGLSMSSPDPSSLGGGSSNGRYSTRLGSGSFEGGGGGGGRDSHRHLTKGQKRKVYGGGRHGDLDSGVMGVGEVAGLIIAGILSSGTPILLPHAAALLGLPLFLSVLAITSALSCFSFIVLGVETRYVGSRSWSSLASAVFPHRFKAHKVGEALAILLVFLSSTARGVVGIVAASEIATDLLTSSTGDRLKERIIISSTIALIWILLPTAGIPFFRTFIRRRPTSSPLSSPPSQPRYPIYISFFFWPLALLILGVRLQTLNLTPSPSTLRLNFDPSKEAMGVSTWGGISILVFILSVHQDTFTFIGSLARPSSVSTAARMGTRRTSTGSSNHFIESGSNKITEGKRNQWPLASVLGVGGAMVIQMGWGLVGYLGIENNKGGREGNLFSNSLLNKDDGWLILVRSMVLIAILVSLEGSLQSAQGRVRKLLVMLFGRNKEGGGGGGDYARLGGGHQHLEEERRTGGWEWKTELSRSLVWIIVAVIAAGVATIGQSGEGMISVAEIVGCSINAFLGFLAPSLFFIVLFHLRKPRSIFITDPNGPAFVTDTLLMRKEREVQRRLSGRRIWQDVLVFGGLLPFGLVVLLRGGVVLIQGGF